VSAFCGNHTIGAPVPLFLQLLRQAILTSPDAFYFFLFIFLFYVSFSPVYSFAASYRDVFFVGDRVPDFTFFSLGALAYVVPFQDHDHFAKKFPWRLARLWHFPVVFSSVFLCPNFFTPSPPLSMRAPPIK